MITLSSGTCSRGGNGLGVSAVFSLVTGGSSGRGGAVGRDEADLVEASRESFLATMDGTLDMRVGADRAIRLGAASVFSDGGKSETEIVSG